MVWRVALLLLVCWAGVVAAQEGDGGDDKRGPGKPGGPRHCLSSCRDDNPCTRDFCVLGGGCVHIPASGPCDDGDACTENDRCVAGTCEGRARNCADAFACTADACVDGRCVHDASDAVCGATECRSGTCSPADPDADARGCVAKAVADGLPCVDDGVACTADRCLEGECRHVAQDEVCGGEEECLVMTCAPARDDADGRGCAPTSLRASGTECAEDDEPCTDDVCRSGGCTHEEVAEVDSCAVLREPYRRARELLVVARTLGRELATVIDRSADDGGGSPIGDAEDDLEAAVRALGGKVDLSAVPRQSPFDTTAQRRARAAATILRRTPGELTRTLRHARRTARARPSAVVRDQGNTLVRGIRGLRRTLVRMTRVRRTL